MELILSLILVAALVIGLTCWAGKLLLEHIRFSAGTASMHSKPSTGIGADQSVYDGMSTVEIPVLEPQVVAYEPPPQIDDDIEILNHPPAKQRQFFG